MLTCRTFLERFRFSVRAGLQRDLQMRSVKNYDLVEFCAVLSGARELTRNRRMSCLLKSTTGDSGAGYSPQR